MTISSTSNTRRTINQIVQMAYQLTGTVDIGAPTSGLEWDQRMAFGRNFLDSILDEIASEGVQSRLVDFLNVSLTANTADYTLSESILELVGDGAYIPSGQTLTAAQGETPVKPVDRETWQAYSSKNAQGRPTSYYAHHGTTGYTITLKLWPRPIEAGTIRFQVLRAPADTLDGTSTIDMHEFWVQCVVWELAHQLAVAQSLPITRCKYLAETAFMKRTKARTWSGQKDDTVVQMGHQTGWSQ